MRLLNFLFGSASDQPVEVGVGSSNAFSEAFAPFDAQAAAQHLPLTDPLAAYPVYSQHASAPFWGDGSLDGNVHGTVQPIDDFYGDGSVTHEAPPGDMGW